jgi:SAM-dependent methyltransferase
MSLSREIQQAHIAKVAAQVKSQPEWRILDVGIGGDKEKPSSNFKFFPSDHFDTLDNNPYWKPMILGDIANPPIKSNTYDLVLCCQTLEHVWDFRRAIFEMHRITKPGGLVYIDAPLIYEFHGLPDQTDDDYWRFTHNALTKLANEVGLEGEAQLLEGIVSTILCKKKS